MSSVVLEWNPGSYFIAVFLTALFSNTPTPTCTAPARVLPARTPRFTSSSIPIINRGLESLWSRFSVKTNHMWVQPPGRNTKRFVDLKIRIVTQVLCLYNLLISTTNLNLHLYNEELYWMLCLLNTGLSHTAKIQFYSSMALTKIVRSIKSAVCWAANGNVEHPYCTHFTTSRMYKSRHLNFTDVQFGTNVFYKVYKWGHLYLYHFKLWDLWILQTLKFKASVFYTFPIWNICILQTKNLGHLYFIILQF